MNIHNIYIIKYLFLLICSELHGIGNNSIDNKNIKENYMYVYFKQK